MLLIDIHIFELKGFEKENKEQSLYSELNE